MKRRTLLFGSLMLLSGCVAVQPLDSRERAGRFSLRAEGPDGIEAVTGRWKLVEAKDFTELTLMTPLYGILARITVTPAGAVLERPNKEGKEASDSAANALELMRKHLGFGMAFGHALASSPRSDRQRRIYSSGLANCRQAPQNRQLSGTRGTLANSSETNHFDTSH